MKTKIIIAVIFVALVAAFFIFDLHEVFTLESLKEKREALSLFYQENTILMLLAFFVLYVIFAAFSLPAAGFLTFVAGAIFGLWVGVIVVSFASTIGATISFLLSRYLLHDAIQEKFGDRLEAVNKGIEKEGAFYVFGLRFMPFIPFFIINPLLGLTKLKVFTFYWASQLGMLAGTAVYVNFGTQIAEIDSLAGLFSLKLWVSFILLGTFPIIAKHIMNFLQRNKNTNESA